MARRIQNSNNPLLLLLGLLLLAIVFLLAAVFTVALYGAPLFLLFGLLYDEFRDNPRETSLTSTEAAQLFNMGAELRAVRIRLSQIEEAGSHLKVNMDGSYHRGSTLGVKLNRERSVIYRSERPNCAVDLLQSWINGFTLRVLGSRFVLRFPYIL
jgi:hypothetical protein